MTREQAQEIASAILAEFDATKAYKWLDAADGPCREFLRLQPHFLGQSWMTAEAFEEANPYSALSYHVAIKEEYLEDYMQFLQLVTGSGDYESELKRLKNEVFSDIRARVVTRDVAGMFVAFPDDVGISGFRALGKGAAAVLIGHSGSLDLSGLESLSDTEAEILSRHKGPLYLNGLTSLSESVAQSLSPSPTPR